MQHFESPGLRNNKKMGGYNGSGKRQMPTSLPSTIEQFHSDPTEGNLVHLTFNVYLRQAAVGTNPMPSPTHKSSLQALVEMIMA